LRRRQVQANAVSISSWDPAQLLAPGAEQLSSLDAGELPSLAVYDGGGERIASASGQPEHISQLMLQALELTTKCSRAKARCASWPPATPSR
jgi:type VI secretion system secreted protein VgrG